MSDAEALPFSISFRQTKKMVIDFRRKSPSTMPLNIQGKDIETVGETEGPTKTQPDKIGSLPSDFG